MTWWFWNSSDFRGRWIMLLQAKQNTASLKIDWNHQEALKNESYYKLDQIKKLLIQVVEKNLY